MQPQTLQPGDLLPNTPASVFGGNSPDAISCATGFRKTCEIDRTASLREVAASVARIKHETIETAQDIICSPEALLALREDHRHHLIIASSEGGKATTTDLDDPEAFRRLVKLVQNLPEAAQEKITFIAYVNTVRKGGNDQLTTQVGAESLVQYLEQAGLTNIRSGIPPKTADGTFAPGIYVVYGDDPGVSRSVGLNGAVTPKQDLAPSASTELTLLMLASPSGIAELAADNVAIMGNARNATNDNYGQKGESQLLLKNQEARVSAFFAGKGYSGPALDEKVRESIHARRIVFDFEDAHANSLTGTQRNDLFRSDAARALTAEKIKQNQGHSVALVNSTTPDGAYGNRTIRAAKQILNKSEDEFKAALSQARKSSVDPARKIALPDFLYVSQLPALVKYIHSACDDVNVDMTLHVLRRSSGFDFFDEDGRFNRTAAIQYFMRPEVFGLSVPAVKDAALGYDVQFKNFVDACGADGRHAVAETTLAAAIAVHLMAIETQLSLLFPHIHEPRIPATAEAFNNLVQQEGGWEISKFPEYDSLAALRLLFPETRRASESAVYTPAALMAAVDMLE